jgi:hypothetical protein
MLDWLEQAQQRLEGCVENPGDLALSPADIESLLELARSASHESGDRTNAPLVTYLVGLTHGRNPGTDLPYLVSAALAQSRG